MKVVGTYIGEKALRLGAQVPVWTDVVWTQTQHLQGTPNAYSTQSDPYGESGLICDGSTDYAYPATFVSWLLTTPRQTQTTAAAATYVITGNKVSVADWKRRLTQQLDQNPRYSKWVNASPEKQF